jgi:hypothetical protein
MSERQGMAGTAHVIFRMSFRASSSSAGSLHFDFFLQCSVFALTAEY